MDIFYKKLKKLKQAVSHHFLPDAILHLDQGFHYTNSLFQKKVKKLGLKQSMSCKDNCWDNAPNLFVKTLCGIFLNLALYSF